MLISSITLLASVAAAAVSEPSQPMATANPRRIAVVVGATGAAPNRKPLRYAHLDAQNVAAVKALTIRDTAFHADAPQHPSFQINLRGRQDLPVTKIAGGESHLALQQQRGPLQVVHLSTGIVLVEAPGGKRSLRLAVPPGTYLVRRRTGDTTWAREVKVEPGKTAHVAEEDLELVAGEMLFSKGATPIVEMGPEEPTPLARAELAIVQTAHGIALGAETCTLAECDDTRAWVLSMIGGGGLGLGLSLGWTGDGIKPGHALLLNSSVGWGFWNGLAISGVAGLDDGREVAGFFMASKLTGLGLGFLLKGPWDPGAGDVALTNTVGIWSGVVVLLAHAATGFEAREEAVWGTLLAAADAGLLGGALLSRRFPMSRGRTLMIDVGGVLGMLGGMGVMLLLQGDDVEDAPLFTSAIVGTVAGLGTATYLTRNWDVPDVPGELAIVPTEGGALALYGARF
jgi:hypothetical protein